MFTAFLSEEIFFENNQPSEKFINESSKAEVFYNLLKDYRKPRLSGLDKFLICLHINYKPKNHKAKIKARHVRDGN